MAAPGQLPARSRREIRRFSTESAVIQARAETALRRQSELTARAQDEITLLALREAAYAQAVPHAAHRLALIGDQHAFALLDSILRAG